MVIGPDYIGVSASLKDRASLHELISRIEALKDFLPELKPAPVEKDSAES